MVETLVFVAVELGSLAAIAGSAWIFGATALRRFGLDDGEPAERWALATALGLGLVAQALFVVGLAGGFERRIVLAALVLGHLVCHRTWRSVWRVRRRAWSLLKKERRRVVLAAAASVPFFVLALYPPTGFDATVYHLPYVEAFLEARRLVFVPELRFPVFPQVVEMGFLLGFAVGGDVAAQLTQVLSMFLTAALVLAFGRRFVSRRAGLWAAALWLGTPLVVWIANMAYVDVGLALFVTAAFHCWERWRDGEDRRWLALAGTFAGLAAGTKYLGLFFCGVLAAATLLCAGGRRVLRPAAVFSSAMLLVLLPWYARIVYHTGNPVFPFYGAIFGESEWTSAHDRLLPEGGAGAVALRQVERIVGGIGFLILTPWKAVFDRGAFNFTAPASPFYLALIPVAAPFALGSSRERRLLLITVLYGLFWLTTVRDLRFLLPIAPVLNLALMGGLDRWTRPALRRRHVLGLTLLLLAPGPLYAAYKVRERGALPVTRLERQDYLVRQLPGHGAIRFLNDELGAGYTVYALQTPRLRYHADGRFLGDVFGPASYHRLLPLLGDSRALYAELRSLGASHLLALQLSPPAPQGALQGHPYVAVPSDDFFALQFRVVFRDSESVLFELAD